MAELDELGLKPTRNGQHPAYWRKGTSGRAMIFIAGFNQPASSWATTIQGAVDNKHTVVVIVRRQEGEIPGRLLGLQSIATQQQEVVETILYLLKVELLGQQLTIIGHSVGAILARHCLTHPLIRENTDRLVQIAPVPLTWWLFTCHLAFWLRGGLLAAPLTLLALLGLTRGLIPPRLAVRGLFCGNINQERFDDYCRSLVPDSALVFLQLVLWYNGTKEWKEVCASWPGKSLIVGSPNDCTISRRAITHLWKSDPTGESKLEWLAKGTPHCFWFQTGVPFVINSAHLCSLIED